MAFTTPTDDLISPQASTNGSEGLYKEHEGNVLTTMHDEQALEHLLENLPDEKVLKSPFRRRLATKCAQVLSYIFLHLHRRQAAIPPFLDRQPSARSQLVALGKLAVVDAPPSPAASPIPIDQTPQAPSPSSLERRLQDEHEGSGGIGICREMATPSDSLATDGYEYDTLPTDEPHTRVSSQERASPDASVPRTLNFTDSNDGSVANPSLVQEGGLEMMSIHTSLSWRRRLSQKRQVTTPSSTRPTHASTSLRRSTPKSRLRLGKMFSLPLSPNADSQPSAKSPPPRRRKRKPNPSPPEPESEPESEPEPERPKKRSTADQLQEELLAKASKLMDDSVTVHDIMFVLERFALRGDFIATRGDHADHTDHDEPQQQDPDRRLGLKKWWNGLGVHKNGERWEKCLQRVFAGLFYGQYSDERDAFNERKEKGNLPHPSELYVDVCSPGTIIPDGELPSKKAIAVREQAKRAISK